ncbi:MULTISPECIES: ABC transporter ATP-binding protein/permease [unclassified Pusillimonas]|uniref:ABC transporter ATP-binding protein/permease n=1 Tax=unclassified Pusillimonas TaxID=2640016 RepID=UPI000B9CF77F|nr:MULTISPECIES: ABC transporter ATP-binding protein/permease [unclassified Pusillimonas]OXR49729.1 ABC transporter ATP-binding protein [Pusillimonas sp. T2]ROT45131.1 ABC transporter ATP-binding protein [Pusillimonas sp. NJUB218]
MDWTSELISSGLWIAKTYAITLVCFALTVWLLAKRTVWGRQFWQLSGAYFSPKRSIRPMLAVAFILFLTLAGVRLQVLFSNWYNTMYSALQDLNEAGFWLAMWLFAALATVHVLRSLLDFYVQQAFTIHWRTWLNEQMLERWLGGESYYRTQHLKKGIDNPDQRIQYDVTVFVESSLTLSMGVVDALVSTVAFTLILWGLSGPLALFGTEIPRGMVFLVFVYVLVATIFAIRIGRPLILLNFLNERFNADYRYALVRLREYAESIAFYAGEKVETALLKHRFAQVISNAWAIVYRSLKFLGFNFSVTQAAVVFPFIIQAQRFFSKQISLGDLMQTAQAFGRLQDNLSFFRNAYDNFASYRATLDRLTGFTQAIDEAAKLPKPEVQSTGQALKLNNLTVRTPTGKLLLENLNTQVHAGQAMLIRGPSGSGKTTLLRAIAGLWPYCDGAITRPQGQMLFLAQKPYLPLGSLRDALHYPNAVSRSDDAGITDTETLEAAAVASAGHAPQNLDKLVDNTSRQSTQAASTTADQRARQVLDAVQLGHLADRLDEDADWSRILSLGEQQRLAFGRLLLAQPAAAFLDEATSAMDEGLEDAMYRLVAQHLPDTLLISVGHRSTLVRHHPVQLNLKGDGGWEISTH